MTSNTNQRFSSAITALGSYVPERILNNADLEKMVDTNNDWIIKRTGIKERRISADHEFTSDLIYGAVQNLKTRFPDALYHVDYIIVATTTPDTFFPSMASRVQGKFQIANSGAIDISAACAGFTSAILMANSFISSGMYRKILIIGAEALSKIVDYTDRTTCILFGDGAGAFVMERAEELSNCVLDHYTNTEGALGKHVYCSALHSKLDDIMMPNGKLVQNGREVFRWAVSRVSAGANKLLHDNELKYSDISWFVPHSANMRIVEAIQERTGFTSEQTLTSMEFYGNTSAASIPLAIDDAFKAGRLAAGDLMLLYGFGGGLTEAAVLLRWDLNSSTTK